MFFFLFCSLLALVVAFPVTRDVWDPSIISPNANTVWVAGCTYPVVWNTSTKPSEVSNPEGMIYLRHNGETQPTPIEQGFPLTIGTVNVTVPSNTTPFDDWVLVLFGDSGNWSQNFTILPPSTCPS